jgi:hypothetical protein
MLILEDADAVRQTSFWSLARLHVSDHVRGEVLVTTITTQLAI